MSAATSPPFDSRRVGLAGSATYRGQDRYGNHRWRIRVHVGRNRYRSTTLKARTLRELRAGWRAFLQDMEIGLTTGAGRTSFEAFVRHVWLPHVRRYREDSTYMRYKGLAENHVLPHLGHVRLERISHGQVQRVVDRMADAGYAPKTIEGARTVMCAAFAYAKKLGYVRRNPGRGVEIPRDRPRVARVVTPADLTRLLELLRTRADFRDLYPAVRLLYSTGMRFGELLALRLEDVDLDLGVVAIRMTLKKCADGGTVLGDTKTHRQRLRWLGPRTVAVLRQHLVELEMHRQRMGAAYADHGLVFARSDGRPIATNTFRRRLARAARETGIPSLVPKDLRSTSETLLVELGWPTMLISKWQGHTAEVSYAHYVGVRDELAAQAAAQLERLVDDGTHDQSMTNHATMDTV